MIPLIILPRFLRFPHLRRATTRTALAALSLSACTATPAGAPGMPSPAGGTARAGGESATRATVLLPLDRQLVRRGRMRVEVERPRDVARRVEEHARTIGGYVSSSRSDDDRSASVTVHVPSAALDATMDTFGGMGRLRDRSTSSTDVTDQVVDLDARRAALVTTRDRMRALLQRADAVRDVLEVEREVARLQGEIERHDARLKALREQVALSELDVSLTRRTVLGPLGLLLAGVGTVVGRLFVWR